MARPMKEGLDYFPLDTDFATNEKTEALMGEFGPKGVLVFMYLLAAVYRNGYYLEWTELRKNQLANRVQGATGELAGLVVKRLISYGTFDKGLFTSDNVLTSARIQSTYLEATKRRKNVHPSLYWINDDINPHSSGVNAYINPQSKVNKTKVNETKTPPTPSGGKENDIQTGFVELWQQYGREVRNSGGFNADARQTYVDAVLIGETTKEKTAANITAYAKWCELNGRMEGYRTGAARWFQEHSWLVKYDLSQPEQRKEAPQNRYSNKQTDWDAIGGGAPI